MRNRLTPGCLSHTTSGDSHCQAAYCYEWNLGDWYTGLYQNSQAGLLIQAGLKLTKITSGLFPYK